MGEEFVKQESKAPFNMAINTLERLGWILSKITSISSDPLIPMEVRQMNKVFLVRSFFLQATPLLKEEVADEYTKEILNIRPNILPVATKNSDGTIRVNSQRRSEFNWELENKLDLFVLLVQRELQREKYFMPPRKNLGSIVGAMG